MTEIYGVLPGTGRGAAVGGSPVEFARGGGSARSLHARVEHGCIGGDVGHDVDVAEHGLDRIGESGEGLDRRPSGAAGINGLESEIIECAFVGNGYGLEEGTDVLLAEVCLRFPKITR